MAAVANFSQTLGATAACTEKSRVSARPGKMGHLRCLTTSAVSRICWFPSAPRVCVLGTQFPPKKSQLGKSSRGFGQQKTTLSVARFLHLRRAHKGDISSQLELGRPEVKNGPNKRVNGIFWILLINIGIYAADHLFQLRGIKALYFYHNRPIWYQFVTSTFCHANWNHLSSNLFFLYIFGKLIEEEEGNFALWLSYILTGAGANLVSWLLLPRNAVSVGASGAVFGLFAISVLVKISWDWRKILEVLILGQFVIEQVMVAAQASAGMMGASNGGPSLQNINHIAHLSGALVGVALIWIISRIPSRSSGEDLRPLKPTKDKRT